MHTIEERINECEKICSDENKTAIQKLKDLIYYAWEPYIHTLKWTTDSFECPYCGEIFYINSENSINDEDICNFEFDDYYNKYFYVVRTPCCGKHVFEPSSWIKYKK